jgi:hypothetical protein
MSAINCLKHKQYLTNLKQFIINEFENIISSHSIAKKFNTSLNYVMGIWKETFSQFKIKQRSKQNQKILRQIKKDQNIKMIWCKFCNKEIKVDKPCKRLFCNNKCYNNYQRQHRQDYAFTKGKNLEELVGKEKAAEINKKRSLKIKERNKNKLKFFIVCKKCKKNRQVASCVYLTHKQKFPQGNYYCRKCKQTRIHLKITKKYKCANCKKEIRRFKNEENKYVRKYTKRIIKFCNNKCYLKYYRSHPQRYKQQRIYAGFASIKSFRNKKNFKYSDIKFSSESEKQCAIFLEKEFGLKLEECKTCHVKINNIEVDFLLDNIIVEYHQCYSNPQNLSLSKRIEIWRTKKYRYEYRTLREYYATRKKKILKNQKLIVIQNTSLSSFKKLKEKIWKFQKIK